MPWVDDAATAGAWASDRAIDLWLLSTDNLTASAAAALAAGWPAVRADGARLAVLLPAAGNPAAGDLSRLADDLAVAAPPAPAPWGAFLAMERAGVADVRRVGLIGSSPDALLAGHRAGCGAVVGLAPDGAARAALLPAQPDAIVAPDEFAPLDAERYGTRRAIRPRVLLNPGPSVVSDRVHRAIGGPDLCHREPEYGALAAGVRAKVLRVAGARAGWEIALLAGSGTAALEAMLLGAVRPGRKLLVGRNGVYGERAARIAARAGIECVCVDGPDLEPINPAAVAVALDADSAIDAVAVVHHETTTGLLNPVAAIAAEADRRGVPVAVDAISSLGAEELSLDGLDLVACTGNKCLHGLPGVAFVLLSPRAQVRLAQVPPRSLYLDLTGYLAAQASGSVPFTPAIPAVLALDAALDELLDEGPAARRAHYAERMARLDAALARLGLAPRVAPAHRSHSVRSLPLPAGLDYDTLHDALKAEGYVVYAGLGAVAPTTFRVCALGALAPPVMDGFAGALARVIASARRPIAP